MRHLRLAATIVLFGLAFIGGVAVRGQRQRQQTEQGVSPILIEARSQMRNWIDATFRKCGGEERYAVLNGRLINFSELVFNLESAPLTRLEEKDGLEFKGAIRLIKADYREYDVRADRWGRFSDNAFVSKGGSLPDLIRVEKKRASDWRIAFDSPYRATSISCVALAKGTGLAGLLGSSGDNAATVNPITVEARKEMDTFSRKVFSNCGGEWYSIIRTATRDYRILRVRGLGVSVTEDSDYSPADRANGIEWQGTGRLEAKIKREFWPSKSERSEGQSGWRGWQDVEGGVLASVTLEKRNGKWLIENRDSMDYQEKCAPTCDLMENPDGLHSVIEDRLSELVSLQIKLDRRLRDFPFVLCASYHDYVNEMLGIQKKANNGLDAEALLSDEEFIKGAEREARSFVNAHYVKCGQYYYALPVRGGRGADVCMVRFNNVTWTMTTGQWVVTPDFSSERNQTGGKTTSRTAVITLSRTGGSQERCVPGRLLSLHEGYYVDGHWVDGGRYFGKVQITYSKDKRGERWETIADKNIAPPTCDKITTAWEAYKDYR